MSLQPHLRTGNADAFWASAEPGFYRYTMAMCWREVQQQAASRGIEIEYVDESRPEYAQSNGGFGFLIIRRPKRPIEALRATAPPCVLAADNALTLLRPVREVRINNPTDEDPAYRLTIMVEIGGQETPVIVTMGIHPSSLEPVFHTKVLAGFLTLPDIEALTAVLDAVREAGSTFIGRVERFNRRHAA